MLCSVDGVVIVNATFSPIGCSSIVLKILC